MTERDKALQRKAIRLMRLGAIKQAFSLVEHSQKPVSHDPGETPPRHRSNDYPN